MNGRLLFIEKRLVGDSPQPISSFESLGTVPSDSPMIPPTQKCV